MSQLSTSQPYNTPRRQPPLKRQLPVNLLLVENRIREFMEHSTRYAFMGPARLAKDCSVSDAAICRLLGGYGSPSFAMVVKITHAFEREFKRSIDPREIAMIDGKYPTASVCQLLGCKGCTPQAAWNRDDTLKQEYAPDGAMKNQRKEER
jgi:DNA-binding phage protein